MKIGLIIISVLLFVLLCWAFCIFLYIRRKQKEKQILSKLSLSFPTKWKELNDKQFLYVATLLSHNNTADEIRHKCFIYFAEIKVLYERAPKVWVCKRGKNRIELDESTILYFSKCFNFITNEMTEIKFLAYIGNDSPIDSQLRGAPLKLWMAAENFYQAFLYTKNEQFLHKLLAVIYCRDYYKDISEFTDSNLDERLKSFGEITKAQLYTCFIAYAGLKNTLSKEFPYLFERSGGGSLGSGQPPKMREMFDNMIYTLSDGGVKDSKSIEVTECWKCFYYLNRKAQENKEMQERLEKIKRK